MYYLIVRPFGPCREPEWSQYKAWRNLPQLETFDSVDSILRPCLFTPETPEDWENCLNEDFKLHLITNVEYARARLDTFGKEAELVACEFPVEAGYKERSGLLGYDIVDGYSSISLLTNWGTDPEGIMSGHIGPNGLVNGLGEALALKACLESRFGDDPHVKGCTIWAVYPGAVVSANYIMMTMLR
jgi:hypothetical protein